MKVVKDFHYDGKKIPLTYAYVNMSSGHIQFGVYDPTLYTSIDFPTDKELVTEGDAFKSCTHQVVRPNPDEVIAENKTTLTDAFFNDPTGTTMSKLFATRIDVQC